MLHTFYDLIGRDTNPILWWQMTIRAVIVFVYAMLLYRIVPVRVFGGSAAPDLVIAVIVGSSLSRALTGIPRCCPRSPRRARSLCSTRCSQSWPGTFARSHGS